MHATTQIGEVRYSVAYPTGAERARKLLVVVVGAVASLFAGCVQLELSSAADCDENSKMRFCEDDAGDVHGNAACAAARTECALQGH